MPARVLHTALLLSLLAGSLPAQPGRLQRFLGRGVHPSMRWGRFSDVRTDLERLYAGHGWALLWTARGRPTSTARALLDVLATANDRGLEAEDYDASQLAALAATLDRGGADAEQVVRFDAALTIGALRFVRALADGRVAPGEGGSRIDAVATVEQLRGTLQPAPILAALEPPWSHYQVLKRALARYRALARDSFLLRLPAPAASGIGEGAGYPGAARLRQLLGALGDLDTQAARERSGDSVFTAELADGIRRFQVRQAVSADGRLTQATWRLLTTHFGGRITQMGLALERWRWLPRWLAGVPILVSLPSQRLHFALPASYSEPTPIHMSVRLGSSFQRQRPVQAGMGDMLVLHPAWDVTALGGVQLSVRGDPNLFLHGASPDVLQDLPSGGVPPGSLRVADAELLAELLLHDRPDWPHARIAAALGGGKPVYLRLSRPVSILVVYGTAVARDNGQVFFYPDLFGEDRRLQQALARGYPYGQ